MIQCMNTLSRITRLNSTAMGKLKADLVLTNCNLVNVYTGKVQPKYQIAISSDIIAYVGKDASHTISKNTKVITMNNQFVLPGLVDPHIHIDQFVVPSELAKQCLLHGVTSLFSDPIDITGTLGYSGFKKFVKLCNNLPIRIFNTIPGGLPIDPKLSTGNRLKQSEIKDALKLPNVVGLGEVFSWTKVIDRDPTIMKTISMMLDNHCIINGHTAGMSDKKLNAYVSSGILSCHEPINYSQVLQRLELGMWVMIRQGSIRRDLKEIITDVISHDTPVDHLMFCSDGIDPYDMKKFGHIDHCINESIKLGLDPIRAIMMGSRNCFDYYNMSDRFGSIAPGKYADIITTNNLKSIKPDLVFVGGKMVVNRGKLIVKIPKPQIPKSMLNTVRLDTVQPSDFMISSTKSSVLANVIHLDTEIITHVDQIHLDVNNNGVVLNNDLCKVASFDRQGSGKRTIALLKNFGSNVGAFASSWSFHENDIIVIGSDDTDMALAVNKLKQSQGGIILIDKKHIISHLKFNFGGIISTESFDKVYDNFSHLQKSLGQLHCNFLRPHLIPMFLPFLSLPSIRLLHTGLVDVKQRKFLPVLA